MCNTLSQGTQHCLASPFPRNLFNPICAESCVQWLKHTIDVSICGMVIRTNIIHMGTPYGLMLIHVYPHPFMFFPTCQVRVVRFYVSCLLLSSSPLLLLLLNRDPRRTVFPVGPQPRPSTPSVPCRTSTTTIPAQCSLPGLNHDHPRPVFPAGPQPRVSLQVFPAGPHVGRSGTKNVQKKVRKNVRQVCYILVANSRVCGRVTGAMPLLTGPSFWMWRK